MSFPLVEYYLVLSPLQEPDADADAELLHERIVVAVTLKATATARLLETKF
jgi:hypothetical protein